MAVPTRTTLLLFIARYSITRAHHGVSAEGGVEVDLVQLLPEQIVGPHRRHYPVHELVHEEAAAWEGVNPHLV